MYRENDYLRNGKFIYYTIFIIVMLLLFAVVMYFFNSLVNGTTSKFKAEIVGGSVLSSAQIQWDDGGIKTSQVNLSEYSHVKYGDTVDIKVKKPGPLDPSYIFGNGVESVTVTDHNLSVFKYIYRSFKD